MINKLFQSSGFKRILIFALMAIIIYALKDMINLILFTFIFTFLMDRLVIFLSKKIPINRKILVITSYASVVGLLSWGLIKYLSMIVGEITQLIRQLTAFLYIEA